MYGDSQAPSPGSVPIFASIFQPKQEPAAVFPKTREQHQLLIMESDANTNYSECRQQFSGANGCQGNSGLLSDVSAPTSMLENAAEKTERFHSRFLFDEPNRMHVLEGDGSRFAAMKSQLPPQYPRQSGGGQLGSLAVDGGGYGVGSSVGLDHLGHGRMASGLMSQDKSPPGLFSHLTSQNGYAGVRGIGGFRSMASGGANGRVSPSSIWLENHMNFASGKPSSLGMLSRNENGAGLGDIKVGNGGSSDNSFINSGFPFGSWNDSSRLAENFTGHVIKREMDIDQKLFANIQHGEPGNRPFALSPHLSLPRTSAQMVAMEKLLQLQDAVPCKIRAKRGCATHPRSIAERVRRSRISERMRKLQDLVPNMDKQTNTADMLDLAIEYIKSLQKQYKTLSDSRANCKCSASQRAALDQTR